MFRKQAHDRPHADAPSPTTDHRLPSLGPKIILKILIVAQNPISELFDTNQGTPQTRAPTTEAKNHHH